MTKEQEIVAWANRQFEKPKTDYGPYIFGGIACFAVLWLVTRPQVARTPAPMPVHTPVVQQRSLAERIAFADRGTYDADTIAPLLKRLASKFSTSEDEIANGAFRAQELLQSKYAVTMSMEDLMAVADYAVSGPTSIDYREALGSYVGFRETKGHYDALYAMQALWVDLGLSR